MRGLFCVILQTVKLRFVFSKAVLPSGGESLSTRKWRYFFFGQLAPSIGLFAPNFAQTLIRLWNTMNKIVVLIGLYLVKIFKPVCFEHNVQEFILSDYTFICIHNSFDTFLSAGSTDVTCEVWCKSVQSPGWSSKNFVCHCSPFRKWKFTTKVGVVYTTQFSWIQGTCRHKV